MKTIEKYRTELKSLSTKIASLQGRRSEVKAQIANMNVKHSTRLIQIVLLEVCTHFRIELNEIHLKTRIPRIVVPRQVAMYLVKEYSVKMKLDIIDEFISERIGSTDRSIIIRSIKAVQNRIDTEELFAIEIYDIRKRLDILV